MSRIRLPTGKRQAIVLTPEEASRTKKCSRCGEIKLWSAFHMRRRGSGRRLPVPHCRACAVVRTQVWKSANADKYALYKQLRNQANRERDIETLGYEPHSCEICGSLFVGEHHNGPHYDHNHTTNVARGWLCNKCNAGLGAFGDNPKIIERAIGYLRERGYGQSRPLFT